MIKRVVVFLVLMGFVGGFGFAQNFTVEGVTGRVQRDGRVEVRTGDVLSADTVVQTGIGASLLLNDGDRSFTIPAARNGRVGELANAASGARIGGNVAHVDTGALARTAGQVSTASARASDAAGDFDIAEE